MKKEIWKPGTMIYPVPAVLVTVADGQGGSNIITVAWTGTVCTNPAMAYISVRPERYSYPLLRKAGEFVINLTTEELAFAADFCGVRSGRDTDKWKATGLTPLPAAQVSAPIIGESPLNIECRVTEVKELGSHHMFLAEVAAVQASERLMDENGRFDLRRAKPLAYCHGGYYGLGELLGTFGYSVRKQRSEKQSRGKRQNGEQSNNKNTGRRKQIHEKKRK